MWGSNLPLTLLIAMPQGWMSARGQVTSAPRPRARAALTAGAENCRQGNFEEADTYLRQAQAGAIELNDAERTDLEAYMTRNNAALLSRREAMTLMRQLEQALTENRVLECAELAKNLSVKRDYL